MAGWTVIRDNAFDGAFDPLAIFNPGAATIVEAAGDLSFTYFGDIAWGPNCPIAYEAVQDGGGLLRRWSAVITSTAGSDAPYGPRLSLILWGDGPGDDTDDCTESLHVYVCRYVFGGKRRLSVQLRSVTVYDAWVWDDADLPIALRITEADRFDTGAGHFHYLCQWKKNVNSVDDLQNPTGWITAYDTGDQSKSKYGRTWSANRIGFCGWYNSSATAHYARLLTEGYDDAGPTITPTPADGTDSISTTPELSYTTADIAGVSAAAEVIAIDGETAWTGEAAQSGFTVTRTTIAGGYQYAIRRTQPFTLGEVVSWTVHSEDTVGNVTESTFTATCSTRTVAADLALQNGPRRLLFAKISGYEPILIQNVDPAPVGWSRSILKCLMAPEEEWSLGLDLATMEVSPSSLMLELENIDDPDDETKKLFSRLFAPGAVCATGVHLAYLKDSGTTQAWIEANATTIDADGAAAFTAPGTAHIGQETFSFSGVSASGFTGCSRGLYPAVGSALGRKYKRPFSDSADGKLLISSVPYCWNGRMVALYLVTWDETVGNWHHDSEAVLLWVGRITDTIRHNPQRQTWQLQCEHVLKDLDGAIAEDMAAGVLQGINLYGPYNMSVRVEQRHQTYTALPTPKWGEEIEAHADVTIPAGFYSSPRAVAEALQTELNDITNWTIDIVGRSVSLIWEVWEDGSSGNFSVSVGNESSDEKIAMFHPAPYGEVSHVMIALGWSPLEWAPVFVDVGDGTTPAGWQVLVSSAAESPFVAYHPCHEHCNGKKLAVQGAYYGGCFWSDQGDFGTARAHVGAGGAWFSEETTDGLYLASYNSISHEAGADGAMGQVEYFVIQDSPRHVANNFHYARNSYLGWRKGDEPIRVQQRMVMMRDNSAGTSRGPFEQLLYVLLSTGTAALNHATYDVMPLELGLGIPSAIVDVQSFLDADKDIAGNPAAVRDCYVTDKSETVKERLLRECQLFGYFLSWDLSLSKLSLKRFMPRADTYVETLDGDVRADHEEWVEPECSTGAVINSWKLECNYNLDTEKYEMTDTVRDQNSRQSLGVTKSVEITHPGVRISEEYGRSTLKDLFLSRMAICGLPWQRCTTTLAPMMIGRVSIGDWVQYVGDHHPDPFGSGAMTCACLAMATNVYWSLGGDRRWTGRDDLLLCARYDALTQVPWAAAALVDIAADNGGWDSTNKRLTLVALQYGKSGDSDCGAAFSVGDMIRIRQINPGGYGPTAALEWGPIEVASAYETDGAQLLTLAAGTTLASWDATQEYVVEPAHYADAVAAQHSRNAWQADATTRLLGTADHAQRWG